MCSEESSNLDINKGSEKNNFTIYGAQVYPIRYKLCDKITSHMMKSVECFIYPLCFVI